MPNTDPIKQLRQVARRRRRAQERVEACDEELRSLVVDAFTAGHSGTTIAAAAGVSTPRAYQIRDGRR